MDFSVLFLILKALIMCIHYSFNLHSYLWCKHSCPGADWQRDVCQYSPSDHHWYIHMQRGGEVSCSRTQQLLAGGSGVRTYDPLIVGRPAQPPEPLLLHYKWSNSDGSLNIFILLKAQRGNWPRSPHGNSEDSSHTPCILSVMVTGKRRPKLGLSCGNIVSSGAFAWSCPRIHTADHWRPWFPVLRYHAIGNTGSSPKIARSWLTAWWACKVKLFLRFFFLRACYRWQFVVNPYPSKGKIGET